MHISVQPAPVSEQSAATIFVRVRLLAVLSCLVFCCFLIAILGSSPFHGYFTGSASPILRPAFDLTSPAAMPEGSNVTLNGRVTFEGTPKKYRPLDMSAEPSCAKFYTSPPMPEISVTGPKNSLQNVVVYISQGTPDETSSGTGSVIRLNQRGCRYAPHIISVESGQEVWVQNDDSVAHSVHPMARVNPEWNRSQPPGTPPVVIRYYQPEFVRVKCELHSWMRGIVAVFKNSHHTVTDENGSFALPDLPPGKYTITAWHELYGSQSKNIVVTSGENNKELNFVFKVTPY